MELGWKIVKYIKSNAIVIANKNQILGVGAGQMSRVDSVKIAIQKIPKEELVQFFLDKLNAILK